MSNLLQILIVFTAYIVAHIVVLQLVGPSRFIRNGTILLVVFLALPVLSIGAKLIFVTLWNMYMFALICSRNSVSLRILDEILRAPGESLSKGQLLERFSDSESLSARIELMEKNAFVHSVGPSEVELSSKGRLLAQAILFARGILGVQR